MIGDEVVVNNARLEMRWTVRYNITKVECLEINTHMNRPGIRGCDFKEMSIHKRNTALYDSEDDTSVGTTICHSRISPFSRTDQYILRVNRSIKRKSKTRSLSFNSNKVSIEDAFTKHLKLLQMFWPGNWRE